MVSWSFDYVGKDLIYDECGNNMIVYPNDQMGIMNQGFGEIPNIFTCSKITNNDLSSCEVSMPSKQTPIEPFCQVLGCNKSLVSSKDYHKRHKVCEIHSKAAKVIVKGVEQRFCQQCSRFHLLCEFDDGKRSCRKRLADHNERRRKPYVGQHSSRHARLLPSCGKFKGLPRTMATSSCMHHDDILHIKLDNEMTTQLHSEPCSDRYTRASNSPLFPIFDKNPTSDFITMDSAQLASDSRSALSLLSSQSQGGFSSRNSTTPMMIPFNHNGDRAFGVSNNMNLLMGCEDMNPLNRVWLGDGSTIELLELESVEHKKEIIGTNGASIGFTTSNTL